MTFHFAAFAIRLFVTLHLFLMGFSIGINWDKAAFAVAVCVPAFHLVYVITDTGYRMECVR